MAWKDFQDIEIDYFITKREDDFDPKKYLDENRVKDEQNYFIERRLKVSANNGTSIINIYRENHHMKKDFLSNYPNNIDKAKIIDKSLSNIKLIKNDDLEIRAKEFENNLGSKKENVY